MKHAIEKVEILCPTCWGHGTVGDYGDEIGEPIDCPQCLGSGKIWDYPEDPEYEPEEE